MAANANAPKVPGPRTGPYGVARSLQAVTIVDGNGPKIFSKKIVQHYLSETCPPFALPILVGQSKYTTMTAVIAAFQRTTSDLSEMPTTPGRPRDVQVAPQPLMAPGSPVTPRTGGMLPFFIAV